MQEICEPSIDYISIDKQKMSENGLRRFYRFPHFLFSIVSYKLYRFSLIKKYGSIDGDDMLLVFHVFIDFPSKQKILEVSIFLMSSGK